MPSFLIIEAKPSGILALRSAPQSKMRSAFRYPTLTSLIGAISYSLFHVKGLRKEVINGDKCSTEMLRNLFMTVAVKVEGNPVIYGSILRINRYYRGEVDSAITSLPMSIMYGEKDFKIKIAYVFNDEILENSEYTIKDFERAGWGIVRIGSRESVVSVENVIVGKGKIKEGNEVETQYSFEFKNITDYDGKGILQAVVDWREELTNYTNAKKMIIVYPIGKVKVRGDLRFIDVDEEVILV
ncbi:type I-A CRISPR-associated protein Cas5a [Methanocaldococcus sp. 28A]